ncbi:MAG: AbrB family transcriptional regulator, partial [Thermoproteota archaeon]
LPKEVRDKLGVEEGDMLRVKLEGERIVLTKEDFWNKLFGCAKGLYDPDEAELELDRGELG